MSTSSLDDVLTAAITNTPMPVVEDVPEPAPEAEVPRETADEYGLSDDAPEESAEAEPEKEVDDYGNAKSSKTYTEDEVNERINAAVRDRLSRLERNKETAPSQQAAQQAAAGFEYNADSPDNWQTQLENFVEQTVSKMNQKQAQKAYQEQETQSRVEFETRFQSGMSKFRDFKDVVGSQPITDVMLNAARSIKDPAAFFYAASKRAPETLQKIAAMTDPYAQIAEIGRLEERMKQSRPTTKAPRPVSRTNGDMAIQHKSDKTPSIEELIAKDAAKRLAMQKARKG